MLILLTNDDGIESPSFRDLSHHLSGLGRLVIVAPDRNQSGKSHAVSDFHNPPRLHELGPDWYALEGTPSDCVHFAVNRLLDNAPDLVISGINMGSNLSEDVTYSGTVGAAMEAAIRGIPSIAVSLVGQPPWQFDAAAKYTRILLNDWLSRILPDGTFLNINVPNISFDRLKPPLITRQGRQITPPFQRSYDKRTKGFWKANSRNSSAVMEDHHAVQKGHISVTPLMADFTQTSALTALGNWPNFQDKKDTKLRERGLTSARSRSRMVSEQLIKRGISNQRVLKVMQEIPRHQFVDEALASRAYSDATLPIGEGQTLSQPYTVARMTEALELNGRETILEIGTGSAYQTAVLSELCHTVYTIERLPLLGKTARRRLEMMGISNVKFFIGDGSQGWPEQRTFDRILVTAGAPIVPEKLTAQLAPNGILVVPEGDKQSQYIMRLTRTAAQELIKERLEACRFVPLIGKDGWE
ncbi:MAG: protein-L-isoaspartate(D-aspartate) O-methyltransferase [Magnetococcales bacterium]|nr:protein-L-isoaspartate(D-aspartate) O-methyltransferase [Magnetococcales bacterium]